MVPHFPFQHVLRKSIKWLSIEKNTLGDSMSKHATGCKREKEPFLYACLKILFLWVLDLKKPNDHWGKMTNPFHLYCRWKLLALRILFPENNGVFCCVQSEAGQWFLGHSLKQNEYLYEIWISFWLNQDIYRSIRVGEQANCGSKIIILCNYLSLILLKSLQINVNKSMEGERNLTISTQKIYFYFNVSHSMEVSRFEFSLNSLNSAS